MIFPSFLTVAALAVSTPLATALSIPRFSSLEIRASKPAAFYLAGDSTTAAQSAAGGGWGVGFLKTLKDGAIGTDLGYNGATTVSFVAGGAWANVIDAVNRSKIAYDPYVTIQVGKLTSSGTRDSIEWRRKRRENGSKYHGTEGAPWHDC